MVKCNECGVWFDAPNNQTVCLECFYKLSTITIIGYPQPKPKKPPKPKKQKS